MILLKRRCGVGLTRVNLRGIRVSRTASGGEPAPSFRRNRPFFRASPPVLTLSSRLSHRYYPRFARPREGNGKRTKQTDRNIARERRGEKQANITRRTNEKKRKEKNFATARRMSSEEEFKFLSSAIVPTTPSERSQIARKSFHHHRSTPRNRRTARAQTRTFFFSRLFAIRKQKDR